MHIKIDCENKNDRDSLVCILARNGYTVRIGREKRGKSSAYTYFVEYWKEGASSAQMVLDRLRSDISREAGN